MRNGAPQDLNCKLGTIRHRHELNYMLGTTKPRQILNYELGTTNMQDLCTTHETSAAAIEGKS